MLIVREYFAPNTEYPLENFVQRSRTALQIARDRVLANYGMPCGLALNQLHQIETHLVLRGTPANRSTDVAVRGIGAL